MRCQLQSVPQPETIAYVTNRDRSSETEAEYGPFDPGALVIIFLSNPREKFWGVLLALSPAGVCARGVDLNSFDDFASLLRAREPATPAEVFFPLHRVERIEIDLASGNVPSLAERFQASSGRSAAEVFGPYQTRSVRLR